MKTIFLDIDGTIFFHHGNLMDQLQNPVKVLYGVKQKIIEWDRNGYQIILVTGRRPYMREITEKQLFNAGIIYDQLIMGISNGERIIINDKKSDGTTTAKAINVKRNEGIGDVGI